MDFFFTFGEERLTKSVQAGGLGLSQHDVAGVVRWQQDMGYCFNWHTGTHGDPCVYARVGTHNGYNLPCIWLSGTNQGVTRGNFPDDAIAVLNGNLALFRKGYGNCYGIDDNASGSKTVGTTYDWRCSKCAKRYGPYASAVAAGLALNSYPPRCNKLACQNSTSGGWLARQDQGTARLVGGAGHPTALAWHRYALEAEPAGAVPEAESDGRVSTSPGFEPRGARRCVSPMGRGRALPLSRSVEPRTSLHPRTTGGQRARAGLDRERRQGLVEPDARRAQREPGDLLEQGAVRRSDANADGFSERTVGLHRSVDDIHELRVPEVCRPTSSIEPVAPRYPMT